MRKLTKLERHIKATALMAIRRIGKVEETSKYGKGIFVFNCDGVYDELVYDFEKKKFIEVRYNKCVGEVITFNHQPYTGYADKIEKVIIPL